MSTELPEIPDAESDTFLDEDGVLYDDDVTPEYGVLGFTLRELLIVGVWAVSFIVSFFPLAGGSSIWGAGIQWILPIGVPTVAVFLLVLRRFSPDGIRRVGSLGIDQFASVAFSVSAVIWVGTLWSAVAGLIEFGVFGLSWSGVVQLVASLALVVLTVFAPIVPGLKEDFHGRLVTLAHRNANPVRPVIARPRPEPAPAADTTQDEVVADAEQPSEQAVTDVAAEDGRFAAAPAAAVTTAYAPPAELDVELSGQQATDEIARFDIAGQVPIAAHASGGDTGTEETAADDEYVPNYSRRSRNQEIASDTASIEALLETAQTIEHTGAVEGDAAPFTETADWTDDSVEDESTNPRHIVDPAQPFWILAPTERDVHDERGEPLFRIGPSAWALVIEDRGGAFVVRHDDGRIGYLHDISDITKG
ncbi:hypothetical protein [Microbacterium sp.]|uniref:hypothetical protein n=1 Tax=Microbacterium sp. TaxID=51671 RepID=UPI002FE342B4